MIVSGEFWSGVFVGALGVLAMLGSVFIIVGTARGPRVPDRELPKPVERVTRPTLAAPDRVLSDDQIRDMQRAIKPQLGPYVMTKGRVIPNVPGTR